VDEKVAKFWGPLAKRGEVCSHTSLIGAWQERILNHVESGLWLTLNNLTRYAVM
jgi:hypothetical protein